MRNNDGGKVMEFQGMPKIARLSRDCVVTEKIDGTNAQIHILPLNPTTNIVKDFEERGWAVIKDNLFPYGIVPGSKNKEITPGKKDNYGFAQWVFDNAQELLKLGPGRHFGEWWGQGIQRGYDMDHKVFSLFNTHRWLDDNIRPKVCSVVPILYNGPFETIAINRTLGELASVGSMANPGYKDPEGIVIFHSAQGMLFKKTIKDDESHKGER